MHSIEDVRFLKKLTLLFLTPVLVLACSLFSIELGGACRREKTNKIKSDSSAEAELKVDHECYFKDEPVQITFSLSNISEAEISFERIGGGSVISLSLEGVEKGESYAWEDESGASLNLPRITLAPGEVYTIHWTVQPEGGSVYRAKAHVWDKDFKRLKVDLTIDYSE